MSESVYVRFLRVGKSYTFAASLAWISPAVKRHILLVSNLETEAEIALILHYFVPQPFLSPCPLYNHATSFLWYDINHSIHCITDICS